MNSTRSRTSLQSMKAPHKHDKGNVGLPNKRIMEAQKATTNRLGSIRERKKALQQDVDKLKIKLRHEENVHRALERAFTRPLGALPRLPPYLPPHTLELLAEVAVLEEEVVRLEDQVVHFRQGLYQEAVYISSSKRNMDNSCEPCDHSPLNIRRQKQTKLAPQDEEIPILNDTGVGKENNQCSNPPNDKQKSPGIARQTVRTPSKKSSSEYKSPEKLLDPRKLQVDINQESKIRTPVKGTEKSSGEKNMEGVEFKDPYSICLEFGKRDIGPYKNLFSVEATSINIGNPQSLGQQPITFFREGAQKTQNFKLAVKKLEEVSVSCRGVERVQLLRRWLVSLKEIERYYGTESENMCWEKDAEHLPTSTRLFDSPKKPDLVLYYDPDVGGEPMNFRDVFLRSQAPEGAILSMEPVCLAFLTPLLEPASNLKCEVGDEAILNTLWERYKNVFDKLEGGISHLPLIDSSARAIPLTPTEWRSRLETVNKNNDPTNGEPGTDCVILDVMSGTLAIFMEHNDRMWIASGALHSVWVKPR